MADLAYPFSCRALLAFVDFPVIYIDEIIDTVKKAAVGGSESNLDIKSSLLKHISATLAGKFTVDPRCPAAGGQPPGRGLLADLAGGDDPMTGPELLGAYAFMLVAGLPTTAAAIGFAMWELARDPELRARLRADPNLIPAFVDEVVRVQPPAPIIARITTKPVTIAGVSLPAGTKVGLHLGAINIEDSEQKSVAENGRARRRNWGFGAGAHRCYGSHLARAEMAVLVDEFVTRIPEFELASGFTPHIDTDHTEMLASLPLTWNPGQRPTSV